MADSFVLEQGASIYLDTVFSATYNFVFDQFSSLTIRFYDGNSLLLLDQVNFYLSVPYSTPNPNNIIINAQSFLISSDSPRLRIQLRNTSSNPVSITGIYTSNSDQVGFIETISAPMQQVNVSSLGEVLLTSLSFVLPLVAGYYAFRYIFKRVKARFKGRLGGV